MTSKIQGISNVQTMINKQGKDLGNKFQKEMINRARQLSVNLQAGINSSVDRGAVAFTSRALLFTYKKGTTSVSCTILVKDLQAKYLYDVIVHPDMINKIVPTSNARLSKQGNIAGLRANLKSGRYKVIKKGSKEMLVDTSKKGRQRGKRVIGVREEKKRKMIYDFYSEAEKGARLVIAGIKGTLRITK